MSQRKKDTHRKGSSSSSENNLWQNTNQPSESSINRPGYPNVPKRTKHDSIQTESQISIIPSRTTTAESSSIISFSNHNAHTRHTLDLITKYTSPQKIFPQSDPRPLSPLQTPVSILSNCQAIYGSKSKRSLSPLDETNQQIHESKRTKSFDEVDEEEVSQFLDYRPSKQTSSQNSNLSQSTTDKPTVRKPTARKLSTNQQKPIIMPSVMIEEPVFSIGNGPQDILFIEPDVDTEEENTIDREDSSWLAKRSHDSNIEHNNHIEPEDHFHELSSAPITPSPIKLRTDDSINTSDRNITYSPFKTPPRSSISTTINQAIENCLDNYSPCSKAGERSLSTTSSFFDTPCSSLSRTTTANMTSTPQAVTKTDRETEMSLPSNIDMMNQLILQTNLKAGNTKYIIDYNPIDLSKKLFYQCTSFSSNNKYQLAKRKQFLHFGRYEIEILFPIDNDKIATIYTCDLCFKHFGGSAIASQRHASKCLYTDPPGKLVFIENDLAIFQIGKEKMNIEQRIYIKSLCRMARLFLDTTNSIDDTKLDRFVYYILCRRDPILLRTQSSIYRFVGYFSKQIDQHAQQSITNLSCLFILPPFIQRQDYSQLLIAFSYFLTRSSSSTNSMYSSPARPLDHLTLCAFRNFWCDMTCAYIINHNHSSIKTIALDTLARQTSIHPRDILSSLYSNGFIIPHPTDKSSVYLLKNAYQAMTSLNVHIKTKLSFMDMKMTDTDKDGKNMMISKQNINENDHNDREEIVLD